MPRFPRHKSLSATFYHLTNRVGGKPTEFPFIDRRVARHFIGLFEFYLRLYFCRLASFQLMGNHYHAVVHFQEFRLLGRQELESRAKLRFGRVWRLRTRHWNSSRWHQFNHDLFDVSRFMQHVNGEFSKWFNHRYSRRGHFWADRFKNPELLDAGAVQATILYCELNAVRAGMVKRPEDHKYGSAYWRWAGKRTDLLIPLDELFATESGCDVFVTYRRLLYYAGALTTRKSRSVISQSILRKEESHGFPRAGLFRRRLRFFTDGLALGGENEVLRVLEDYRRTGRYRRRKHPIPQLDGLLFTLREQRSNAFELG